MSREKRFLDVFMEKPVVAFMEKIEVARTLVAEIDSYLDDHLGVDPEQVNWSDVADAERVVGDLKNICAYLFNEEA